jgi:hypothetical protein
MTTISELLGFHEICQLKYRYIRALDTQNWPLLESCFTEDVMLWPNGGDYIARGRAEVMAMVKMIVIGSFFSSHTVAHPEIEFVGEDRAKGIWRLEDTLMYTEPHPGIVHTSIKGGEQVSGAAYYYDEYVRTPAGWKIASCGFIRIFESLRRSGAVDPELTVDRRRGVRTPN